ncbi:MAG: tetratricopeptide repeat-containing glycosyltransferase family protein, partial [Desulfobacterales bacterium]|nr:tetratricopeptide repeat-containing glycosyltransferase family protein [Desulfobacterales bacterium]
MGKHKTTILQLLEQGIECHNKGDLDGAEQHYRAVLEREPNQMDAIHFMGVLATGRGDIPMAKTYLSRAIELGPNNAACHNNMGNALQSEADYRGAISCYEKTLELDPNHHMAYNNLGAAHIRLCAFETARAYCQKATEMVPDYSAAWNNLGDCLANLGELEQAMSHYERALELEPDMVDAHWNRALCLLTMGDLEQGFDAYRWRWKRPDTPRRDIDPARKWNGTNFCGRSIFVYEEQGLGDTLQFVRYLPLLKGAGGRVIFESSPSLARLFMGMDAIDKLWVRHTKGSTRDIDRFDSQCPILDLPYHFRTTSETIPAQVPYIHADAAMAESWSRRLKDGAGFRVGIVWAGNPGHKNNKNRSCLLSAFTRISQMEGVSLYGIQKDKYEDWTDVPPATLLTQDLGDDLFDFADTAAVIENMDLVISVDTSVVHLA